MSAFNQQGKENTMNYGPKTYADSSGTYASPSAGQITEKYSEIEERLRRLENLNERLAGLTAGFQVKLQPVLAPQMANKANGSPSTPKPIASPMSDRLDTIAARFEDQMMLMQDVYDRIAL